MKVETSQDKRHGKDGKMNPVYCDKWVYWLAFLMVTAVYLFLMALFCLFGALMVCYIAGAPDSEEQPINAGNSSDYSAAE